MINSLRLRDLWKLFVIYMPLYLSYERKIPWLAFTCQYVHFFHREAVFKVDFFSPVASLFYRVRLSSLIKVMLHLMCEVTTCQLYDFR